MTKPTLLILAAGIGSRYGGIKQLDKFGPNGETIIDYSLFDAFRAGFGKVVFIIREELKADFQTTFGSKLNGKMEYDFAIQSFQKYVPAELGEVIREKPWGTGHAVLCAWEQTQTPFAVINADDFYGFEGYKKMADFLSANSSDSTQAMVGYQIKNTLSENGTVSRGVCEVNDGGFLDKVTERTKILRKESGEIVFIENDTETHLDDNTLVSMNFWGFKPSVFPIIQTMFENYAKNNLENPKAEFYIPTIMTYLIENQLGECKVYGNEAEWFGVTYPEDKPQVVSAIANLIKNGNYPEKLWD